jgi:hypothetical protein
LLVGGFFARINNVADVVVVEVYGGGGGGGGDMSIFARTNHVAVRHEI